MQLRTHADNPFPVFRPSHDSFDSRHSDSPVERRRFEDVAAIRVSHFEKFLIISYINVDCPFGHRHFKDVAGIAENRRIERGRNSIRLYMGKRRVYVFKTRICAKIFSFCRRRLQ